MVVIVLKCISYHFNYCMITKKQQISGAKLLIQLNVINAATSLKLITISY
nr:MAG TPA: hypothetical protein [Caudoviricetes sp.]